MNAKVMNIMLTLLILITIAGIIIVIFLMNDRENTSLAEEERTVEDLLEDSFETEEIITDLKDGNYVKIQFRIVTDSEDTVKILKDDFRVRNIIIKELSVKEEEDIRSGLTALENSIKDKLNEMLKKGEVTDVYTTDKVLQ
jgi:flagellar protein FliL